MSDEVCVLSLSPCLLYQGCVLVHFGFWRPPFSFGFPTDKVPDQISRLPPWNKHSDTLTGPHQLVWLISFGSHHCLPYPLFVSFVSFYVLVYGFLLFQLSFGIGKVLDQKPSKNQTLSCTQPCTHPSILWKGIPEVLPSPGWLMLLTHSPISPQFLCGRNYCFLYTSGDHKWNSANGRSIFFFFSKQRTTGNIAQKQKNSQYIWHFPGYRT